MQRPWTPSSAALIPTGPQRRPVVGQASRAVTTKAPRSHPNGMTPADMDECPNAPKATHTAANIAARVARRGRRIGRRHVPVMLPRGPVGRATGPYPIMVG